MCTRISPSAKVRRAIGLLALAALLVHGGLAMAQTGAPVPVNKHYTKDAVFHLPIKIDDPRTRAGIKEVQLYVKVGSGDWLLRDRGLPTQQSFKFKVPADGEYWFTLVTLDTANVPSPADLTRLRPEEIVMVVVDTQAPQVDVQPAKLQSGEVVLRCTVTDANPDYQTLRVTYQGTDGTARALEPAPGQPGALRVPGAEVFANPVRITVADSAGNVATKEVHLQEWVAKLWPAPTQAPIQTANVSTADKGNGVQQAGGPLTTGNDSGAVLPAIVSPAIVPPTQIASSLAVEAKSTPVAPPVVATSTLPVVPPVPGPVTTLPASTGSIPKQILSSTRVALDYHIDQVGSSGVGKVEVWMTTDQGSSWKRLCEDVDRKTPADFDLPGDGLFGIRVVVTNGNGFGGRPPASGEQPQVWIEVDTVAPIVHLKDLELQPGSGAIEIRWTATDRNFGNEPINLLYSTHREGPWQPLARGLKNDGMHRWVFPRDTGNRFFVRLEATDAAGNVMRCETPTAIVLDLTEPRASVVGVSSRQ